MKCTLHIGTEKTGSTSIQEFLSLNRQILHNKYGILYPAFEEYFKTGSSHRALAYYCAGEDWLNDVLWQVKSKEEKIIWKNNFRNHLENLINDKQDCNHCFLSSEHLHSRLTKKNHVENLHNLLLDVFEDINIVIFLKPQSTLAVSRYSTELKNGRISGDFFPSYEKIINYYDYFQLLSRWEDVFGEGSLTIKILDDNPLAPSNVVGEICNTLGINANLLIPLKSRKNVSLGAASLDFLKILNLLIKEEGVQMSNYLRRTIINTIQDFNINERKFPSRKSAKDFDELYSESNQLLAERLNLSRPLFEVDYSRYPELATGSSLHKIQSVFRHLLETMNKENLKSSDDRQAWERIKEFFLSIDYDINFHS